MEKLSYTKIALIKAEFLALRAVGQTRREVEEHFGLELKQIEQWITQYNRRQTDKDQSTPKRSTTKKLSASSPK